MTESRPTYPVRVDAAVDPQVSRALWLVKWLLLVPHWIVLAFLWLGFVVVSVLAFFAILFTGRYPRSLFEFNVGVLRWSWRVHYYGYGANGTDRYPPFSLADVPDYPAHYEVPYPERLSRGLVLVKWLLAIPHYVVLVVFIGGGAWLTTRASNDGWSSGWGWGGLVGLLVFIAAVVLLFSGRYPRALYDFVLGMDRWALRVAAYVGLMTDAYPPFRLDMGGPEPGAVPATPIPSQPLPTGASRPGWTAGRVIALVIGSLLLFAAAGTLIGGGTLLWADRTQREAGYLSTPAALVRSDGYAVTTEGFRLEGAGFDWAVDNVLGRARIEVSPVGGSGPLFVGIAPTAAADRYLDGVAVGSLEDLNLRWDGTPADRWTTVEHAGGAPATPPTEAGIWTDSSSGPGTQVLTWRPTAGNWTVVVMRADGTAGVSADVRAGATLPGLPWIAGTILGVGVVLLVIGGLLVALAVRRAAQPLYVEVPTSGGPPAPAEPQAAGTRT
ncbi:DUF4389 domain-containing protein [Petropleomorpha daqingensis]|uniref:DUF4389 domain-containing protein n=1 Tax=Petropleomorpha daqingensis TaxID=2026353 RepID=A0A853CMH0_9ACTN|nr:DUF4389 domain-containing protein [Petropleomorpha daqingensis]NYJ08757.1 hypothetical protein [Petropleomorpha daqingensis]